MTWNVRVDKDGNEIWTDDKTGEVDIIAKPPVIVHVIRLFMWVCAVIFFYVFWVVF